MSLALRRPNRLDAFPGRTNLLLLLVFSAGAAWRSRHRHASRSKGKSETVEIVRKAGYPGLDFQNASPSSPGYKMGSPACFIASMKTA
jgi:hypothetical protein